MIDYRKLLKKYIEHVGNEEGITFLSDNRKDLELFTEEEWEELIKIDNEVFDEVN